MVHTGPSTKLYVGNWAPLRSLRPFQSSRTRRSQSGPLRVHCGFSRQKNLETTVLRLYQEFISHKVLFCTKQLYVTNFGGPSAFTDQESSSSSRHPRFPTGRIGRGKSSCDWDFSGSSKTLTTQYWLALQASCCNPTRPPPPLPCLPCLQASLSSNFVMV